MATRSLSSVTYGARTARPTAGYSSASSNWGPSGKTYRGVQQRFVKLGAGRGDQVSVISGLAPGEEVVSSGVFKLRSGAAVVVNNKISPSNNPAPKPEDS